MPVKAAVPAIIGGVSALASAGLSAATAKKPPDPFNPVTPQQQGPAPITGGGSNPISPLQRNNPAGDRYQAVNELLG